MKIYLDGGYGRTDNFTFSLITSQFIANSISSQTVFIKVMVGICDGFNLVILFNKFLPFWFWTCIYSSSDLVGNTNSENELAQIKQPSKVLNWI